MLLLLAIGAGLGFVHTVSDLRAFQMAASEQIGATTWFLVAALAAVPIVCAWRVARRSRPLPPRFFLAGLVITTLLLRAILIAAVEPAWSTDYLRYWEQAMALAASGEFVITNIFQQRAALVPYPTELLFGPGAVTALKWVNAFLVLAVQLATYDMLRLTHGHRAAQAASILILASPLPAYAALLPSHDIWALAFLVGMVWAVTRAGWLALQPVARVLAVIGLAALGAVLTYCLELQRSTGILTATGLIAASVFFFLGTRARRAREALHVAPRAVLTVAVLSLVLYPAVAAVGSRAGLERFTGDGIAVSSAMKYAAHGSAMGTGRSAWYARFRDRFHAKTLSSPEEADDFARSVVLSTWAVQPAGKLDAMQEHAQRLFSLSYPPDWDTLLRRPDGMSSKTRSLLIAHLGLFGGILLVTTLLAYLRFVFRPGSLPFPLLAGAVFLFGLALVLLVLFENKPFNISPAWWLYPMLVGTAMAGLPTFREGQIGESRLIWPGVACAAAAPLAAISVWALFEALYSPSQGRILSGWQIHSEYAPQAQAWGTSAKTPPTRAFEPQHFVHDRRSFVLRDAAEDGPRIHERADQLYLSLRFPTAPVRKGDGITATRMVCLDGERRNLEFFMFAPYLRSDVHRAYSLEIAVDGALVASQPIPHEDRSDSMRLVTVPLAVDAGGNCFDLAFTLRSNVSRSADSWARASHVEIWFPRLAL